MAQEEEDTAKIFACPQCPKIFATRSNLKRHMENPNIHNIPYIRSRDQKRWKGHAKKVVSKEETTERMRKWRAENREKNRQNDLRCRVYRLARQKYGEQDSAEKQNFVRDEITRRLGRRTVSIEHREFSSEERWQETVSKDSITPYRFSSSLKTGFCHLVELPFYSAPQQTIELPSIIDMRQPLSLQYHRQWNSSLRNQRRISSSSFNSVSSLAVDSLSLLMLPPIHSYTTSTEKDTIKYVEQTKILDEFVGVVLHYADSKSQQQQQQQQITEPSAI
ncbi:hypothetical protein BDF14DRAFT_1833414 [Spinellus fusiger]|nr:hypothetical protein BDF14DRAFT_1833414 [Spinellus fusiger]